ncbi:hypothetical protein NFI96_005223 [Prochilodus magdalenae]|nr:hypothetical protein NFI96_005223 [Prochilodus magdalenae]
MSLRKLNIQVNGLRFVSITTGQVLVVWRDQCVGTKCVKTYEVEFSKDGTAFQRINSRDTVFTSHTFTPVPADGAVGVEVEGHQAFWTCDSKSFISVLTMVPPHTGSLGVSTKTKAGLVTEDDPLPF